MGNYIMLKKVLFLLFITPCFAKVSGKKEPLFIYQDRQTQYCGFKNQSGKVVIPASYGCFYEVSLRGRPLFVEPKEDLAFNTSALPNMVAVYKDQSWWWIDSTGKILFESFLFDNGPDYFHQGLSRIIEKNKFGFIDQNGRVIIKPQYDFASPFFLITSEKDIDYDAAEGMENRGGYAFVSQGCWRSYPPNTKFPISHSRVPPDLYPDIVGGKWGVISTKGEVIVELSYDSSKEAIEALKVIVNKKAS